MAAKTNKANDIAFLAGAIGTAVADLNDHVTVLLSAIALARARLHATIVAHDQWAAADWELDAANLAAHRCARVAQALLTAMGLPGQPGAAVGPKTA